MNKKMFVSIVALGAIIAGSANAAIKKEQCVKSDKTIWVENVTNADGSKGACVPKNACSASAFRNDFCVSDFDDIQVSSAEHAKQLVQNYAKLRLGWKEGCTNLIEYDIDNVLGQDVIGCYSNGNYRAFEFDDTNESDAMLGARDLLKGNCITLNGQFTERGGNMICSGVNKTACDALDGEFTSGDSTCDMGSSKMTPTDIAKIAAATMTLLSYPSLAAPAIPLIGK